MPNPAVGGFADWFREVDRVPSLGVQFFLFRGGGQSTQPGTDRKPRELHAVRGIEFLPETVAVAFDGADAPVKPLGDLGIAEPLTDQDQHLDLADRERGDDARVVDFDFYRINRAGGAACCAFPRLHFAGDDQHMVGAVTSRDRAHGDAISGLVVEAFVGDPFAGIADPLSEFESFFEEDFRAGVLKEHDGFVELCVLSVPLSLLPPEPQ